MDADMRAQVEVLVYMINFSMDMRAAFASSRMRGFGGTQPNDHRLDRAGYAHYENGFPSELIEQLRRLGHLIEPATDRNESFMGSFQGIRYDAERKIHIGASASRHVGCAFGY